MRSRTSPRTGPGGVLDLQPIAISPWSVDGVSVTGLGHAEAGDPCEDAWSTKRDGERLVVVVCDGAGGAAHGGLGARALAARLPDYLLKHAAALVAGTLTPGAVRAYCLDLLETRTSEGCDVEDLAATLVALVIDGERAATVHVGDGAVVAFERELPRCISRPEGRDNFTKFVTSAGYPRIQRFAVTPEVTGFALMTDGAADGGLYDDKTNVVSRRLPELSIEVRPGEGHRKQVRAGLQTFLEKVVMPRVSRRDDATLVLVRRKHSAGLWGCPRCAGSVIGKPQGNEFQVVCSRCERILDSAWKSPRRYPRLAREFARRLVTERGFTMEQLRTVVQVPLRTLKSWLAA